MYYLLEFLEEDQSGSLASGIVSEKWVVRERDGAPCQTWWPSSEESYGSTEQNNSLPHFIHRPGTSTVGQAKTEKRRKQTRPVEQSLPIYAGPQRLAPRPPTFLYLPPSGLQERGTLLHLPAGVVQHSTPSGATVAGTSVASAIGFALSASSASVSAPSAPSAQTAVPSATTVIVKPPFATAPAIQVTSTSKTTAWRRKKQERGLMERKQAPRRPFRCGLCQKERAGGNHKQYYGAWWCGEASSQSYEAWVEERKRARTERQRESP